MQEDNQKMLQSYFETMKEKYASNPYPDYNERKTVLKKLRTSILEHETEIIEALNADFGYRSDFDTVISDILPSVHLIDYCLKHLKKWMKPSKRHSSMLIFPSRVKVHYQPLGVVGVITPWNFPVYLSLAPTIQALAAGNTVLIKMSGSSKNITKVMKKMLAPISDSVRVVDNVPGIGSEFSKLPFNHLLFTGSPETGKKVAQAAGANLTPVTLELGGKSPVIVGEDADITTAIESMLVGVVTNGGQICVSPDYAFVPENKKDEFITTFLEKYTQYYISDTNKNKQTHVISEKQLTRLQAILDDAKEKGAIIHSSKEQKDFPKQFTLNLVENTTEDMRVMQEEIFGTIFPIKTYKHLDEVIEYINAKPRPLALYLMSDNTATREHIIKNTHSGGICVNDASVHVLAEDAPFGGIDNSGIGHYHGHEGFLTFSKAKTVLVSYSWLKRNRYLMKNRDTVLKIVRRFLLK